MRVNDELIMSVLRAVRSGTLSESDALERLRSARFEDLGFARVDHDRSFRCGFGEVIYCAGKTDAQVADIFAARAGTGENVLATRATPDMGEQVRARNAGARYDAVSRTIVLRQNAPRWSDRRIVIAAAGTSDIPVAEEARITADIMDQRTCALYDVGVAGIERLLACRDELDDASVIVVVAGMEGALPSVVSGLVRCPVIAVPTSVGYGASFGGLAALLAMLNCCAAGVSVVNIDGGFAGGYMAAMINRGYAVSPAENNAPPE